MSSYQNLQFLVQFTYDAKSLKDIQDKANNLQVKPIKIKFDTKEAEKQIDNLTKKILEQTQKLAQAKQKLSQVQQQQPKTQAGTTGQKQAQQNVATAQAQLTQSTNALAAAQARQSAQTGTIVDQYQRQAMSLLQLQSTIQGYQKELAQLAQKKQEQGSLSLEEEKRAKALVLAIEQTKSAYRSQSESIVANTQSQSANTNQLAAAAQAISQSYGSQITRIAELNTQLTALKAQTKELEAVKSKEGALTESQSQKYAVLQQQIRSITGERNKLQSSIAQNEKAQRELGNTVSSSTNTIVSSYHKESGALAGLLARQRELKEEIKALETAQKSLSGINTDQEQRLASLKLAYKEVSMDVAQATRDSVSQERATRNAGTSYNDLQQRMAALSVEIRNTQDPLGKNREAVARMTKEYDTLNTKLKTIDSAMGNQQRNVGNYTDSIRAAANALAVVQGPLGPLAGRLNSLATTIGRINEMTGKKKVNLNEVKITTEAYNGTLGKFRAALMANVPLIGHFNKGIQAQAVVTQQGSRAVKILSGTLAILKTALAATGIGLLVVGLGALVSFFKRTEKGAQALRVIMAGVSAVVETLRARSIELGERIFNAFKNPKQAIKDLGNLIVQNLINRVKGVGDLFVGLGKVIMSTLKLDAEGIKAGAADMGNALIQVTTGVDDAGGAFKNLTDEIQENVKAMTAEEDRLNKLKVAQREMNVERAKASLEVQKARALARDATVSYEEQIAALEKVKAAEEDRFAREKAIAEERLEIAKIQLDRFPSDEKAIEEVAQAEIAFANLKKDFFTQEIRLFRDLDSRKRAIRERENRELRETQKIREGLADVTRSIDIAELRRSGHKLAALQQERQFLQDQDRINTLISEKAREIMNQEGENYSEVKAKQRAEALIKADVEKELAQNYLQLLDLQYNAEEEMINQRMSLRQMERQAELDDQLRFFNNRNDAVSAAEARRNFIVEKYDTERDLMIQKRADELYRKTQDRAFAQAQAEREIRLQQQQELASAEQAIQDAKRDYNVKTIDTIQNAAIKGAEAIFGQNKAIQSAAVVVDTLKGAQRALSENPPPSPIGIASAAAVVAQGAIALRKINATKKGDKSVGGAGAGANIPTEAFGLVDANKLILPGEIASQLAGQQPQVTNNIILEGELDSELLAIKVRDGNNTISAQTISV